MRTVYHALLGLGEVAGIRTRAERGGYDVVPANRDLAGAEVELVELPARETRLKAALERVADDYDYILIDCPPSLSLLTVNALAAAQRVLIPMQCEYYALEGLSDLVGTIKRVRANLNPTLEIAGLLRTMYDPRNTLSQQVSRELESHFGDKVFRTLVPRNVRLAEAPSYGVPAVVWDASSKGAQAYVALRERSSGEPMKPRGLGRGLDALLGGDEQPRDALLTLPVGRIRPGRYQPRTKMDQQALAELAASIRSQGLMQPLLVRPVDRDRYELVAGERRWRAAQMAGLEEVPALVREIPDEAALAMSLIENIQRENLNPMEEAAGIQRLVDEFRMTHEQAADAVVAAQRHDQPAAAVEARAPRAGDAHGGALEMGHARALLALDGARQIETGNVSPRRASPCAPPRRSCIPCCAARRRARSGATGISRAWKRKLPERLGTTVEIRAGKKGSGRIVLHYSSLEHLEELLAKLK